MAPLPHMYRERTEEYYRNRPTLDVRTELRLRTALLILSIVAPLIAFNLP